MRAIALCSVLALSLFACAASPEEGDTLLADESDLTSKKEAVLHFDADRVYAEGDLVEGAAVRVVYDTERTTRCRGEQGGVPQWTISGFYRINSGEIASFGAGGLSETNGSAKPIIKLSEPGDLELWFQNTNRWGCSAYDSDYGANFHFKVSASKSQAAE